MTPASVAGALGRAVKEGRGWRCRCPVCGKNNLSVVAGRKEAVLVHCWNGCDWRDIFAWLCDRGVVERRSRDSVLAGATDKRSAQWHEIERLTAQIERARSLHDRSEMAAGTIVETYLRSRRISLPVPPELRFLRYCPHRNGKYYPAMVAAIVNVRGERQALHKTFLKADGSGKAALPKREQREFCGPVEGCSVRLAPAAHTLIVGEGIETTLSAMEMFNLPGWAALSAEGVKALELPPAVREVWLAADNDESLAGHKAALVGHERWTAEGRAVQILMPPRIGQDFNDLLVGGAW